MSIRRVRVLVGVVAVGFVLALVLGSAGLLGGSRAIGSSTTLTLIGGDVSVRHGANGAFVAAVDGEVLNPGDSVRTGADSRAVLTYFEGSTVTIEPRTELSIDAAATNGNVTVVQMSQSIGRTWHVVTRLVTGTSKYEVRTPASTASVRGTAFTVDTDGDTTTIETTEGTVLDQVPDPQNPGRTIDVPVRAGEQHRQQKGKSAAAPGQAPDPDRKVTVTLSEENTIIIDTLGRANGIDKNGKKVLQTPGAKLEVIDGRLVITLPNIPDGRLQALVRKAGGGNVDVQTVVEEHGKISTSSGTVNADASGQGRANVDITSGSGGGSPNVQQMQAPSPTPGTSLSATPTQVAGGGTGGGGTSSDGTSTGGQGQGGGTPQGGGQGQGGGDRPAPTSGFVPKSILPVIPGSTPTPTPNTGPGNGQGGGSPGGGNPSPPNPPAAKPTR